MPDFRDMSIYPLCIKEKVRLSDTDRQGHVNNVCFSFFYESGRALIVLDDPEILDNGCFFVIVSTTIDFNGELHFPGEVTIANAVERIGKSSITVRQALFQNGRCASISYSTMAQVDIAAKVSRPLSDKAREHLGRLGISI